MVKTIVLIFAALTFCLPVFAMRVDVFTVSEQPYQSDSANVHVYVLDKAALTLQTFNKTLANAESSNQAQHLIKTLLTQNQTRLEKATKALMRAKRLGVTHLPTVVINDKYFVVGTSRVAFAIHIYNAWLQHHGDES